MSQSFIQAADVEMKSKESDANFVCDVNDLSEKETNQFDVSRTFYKLNKVNADL